MFLSVSVFVHVFWNVCWFFRQLLQKAAEEERQEASRAQTQVGDAVLQPNPSECSLIGSGLALLPLSRARSRTHKSRTHSLSLLSRSLPPSLSLLSLFLSLSPSLFSSFPLFQFEETLRMKYETMVASLKQVGLDGLMNGCMDGWVDG